MSCVSDSHEGSTEQVCGLTHVHAQGPAVNVYLKSIVTRRMLDSTLMRITYHIIGFHYALKCFYAFRIS